MSSPLSVAMRPLVRRGAVGLRSAGARRFESSTTAKATEAAKETAAKATSTASSYATAAGQGLSRVTSAAGPAIANAAKGVTGALGSIGGRTGRIIGFIERQTPFVIYYSRVGLELGRLVFHGQKMSPPSIATFQSYFQALWKQVSNPSAILQTAQSAASAPASVLQQIRGVSRTQLIAGGVLLAELLGFFTVGEMIGRFKLIGYHGEPESHH